MPTVRGTSALRVRSERLDAARAYLEHVLTFHQDVSPDGCARFEALIWERRGEGHGDTGHSNA